MACIHTVHTTYDYYCSSLYLSLREVQARGWGTDDGPERARTVSRRTLRGGMETVGRSLYREASDEPGSATRHAQVGFPVRPTGACGTALEPARALRSGMPTGKDQAGMKFRVERVGKALVAAAEQWAADIGTPHVFLRSNILRQESHPFYESLGYTRTKTQHAYSKRFHV